MIGVVRHDNQEDETGLSTRCNVRLDTRVVVELDTLGKGLEELVFILGCPVLDEADVSILNEDIQSLLDGHIVELLVDIASVLLITLQTEDSEVL